MLKNPPPLEVMLAHRALQRVDRNRDQGIALPQLAEGQMEGLLVSVQMLIVEVGILIEPHGEAELPPATSLVNHYLAGLKFRFPWRPQSAAPPDDPRPRRLPGGVIRPENRPAALELGRVEQELGINHRDIVRVQQQNLAKGRVKNGVRLQLPSV